MRVPHPPEYLRRASTLAHRVVGALLGIVGLLVLGEALAGSARSFHLWWSGSAAVLGLLFVAFMLFHHGFRLLPSWLADLGGDPQQRQHVTIGILLTIGAAVEFARTSTNSPSALLRLAWPLALLLIGVMFVRHTQHGTGQAVGQARRFHTLLGWTLVAAALLSAAAAFSPAAAAGPASALALLAAAVLLLSYREPAGAWEPSSAPHHQMRAEG